MPVRKIINKQLGELLVERGSITPEQLQKALAYQKDNGGLIGEIFVELGFLKEEDIAQALKYAAWRAEEIELPLQPA